MTAALLAAIQRRPRAALALAAALAAAFSVWRLALRFDPAPEFDARAYYLPFARRFLDDPAAFLASEESLWTAPLAWLWPALLGASPGVVKGANIALFAILVLLAARIGERLHSAGAGAIAAVVLAASPLLRPHFATALTEPPFVLLVGVWIAALAESVSRRDARWAWVAGAALGLALLARPTYLYFVPAVVAACAWLVATRRDGPDGAARLLLVAHAIALAIALAAIARNAIVFGYPSIATGAGTALYFGQHVLTGGYDSNYLGLIADAGQVTDGKVHLSIEGDRILRATALAAMADTPLPVLARMYAAKLGAFLFVTQAGFEEAPSVLRGWRIALLVFAAWGWWAIRMPAMRLLLGAALVYQVAVHIPALYVHRYSVGAIDLPLALMAAVGLADALARPRALAALAVAALLGIGLGRLHALRSEPMRPDIDAIPRAIAWDARQNTSDVRFGQREGFGTELAIDAAHHAVSADIRNAPLLHPHDNSVLSIAGRSEPADACTSVTYSFRKRSDADFGTSRTRPWPSGGRDIFASSSALGLQGEGQLRIELQCAPGARWRLESLSIAAPRFGLYYRDRSRGLKPPGNFLPPSRP